MQLSAPSAGVRAVVSMLEDADLHMKRWDMDDGLWESSPHSRRVQGDGRSHPVRSGYLHFKHYHDKKKRKKNRASKRKFSLGESFVPPGHPQSTTLSLCDV